MAQPVRGTQTLVDQMGWVFSRPTLTLLEVAWRWLFGLPLLLACLGRGRAILAAVPVQSTPLASLDTQNPWVAVEQLASAWEQYWPHVSSALVHLLPLGAVGWIVLSAIGRSVVLRRLEPDLRLRPLAMIALQTCWLAVFALVFGGWLWLMQWAGATHIATGGEADLVGFSIWAIVLSLAFFTLWALISWPFAIAPVLLVLENRSAGSALATSFQLGREFSAKLREINLVMGIVKLALVVLAMVFSAAPLPFSDQLGKDALHAVYAGAFVFYILASDYFHVVRLKAYVEFWRTYRGS